MYVFDGRGGVTQALYQGVAQFTDVESDCLFETEALLEQHDQPLPQVLTLLWEGRLVKPIDQFLDHWLHLIFLGVRVVEEGLNQIDGDLSVRFYRVS